VARAEDRRRLEEIAPEILRPLSVDCVYAVTVSSVGRLPPTDPGLQTNAFDPKRPVICLPKPTFAKPQADINI
jgi:hypothetical protein